jgi:hypothetical protein
MFYFADSGEMTALRFNDWKVIFLEQKTPATSRAATAAPLAKLVAAWVCGSYVLLAKGGVCSGSPKRLDVPPGV